MYHFISLCIIQKYVNDGFGFHEVIKIGKESTIHVFVIALYAYKNQYHHLMIQDLSLEKNGSRAKKIAATLRGRIIADKYPPGSQLPTFDDFVREFGVSRATVQLAIRQLREENFVFSENRKGLYVAQFPPHRYRYGIAFPSAPGEPEWTRFHAAIEAESRVVMRQRPGTTIVGFHGLREGTSSPELDLLLRDASTYQLAGLLLIRGTNHLLKLPELAAAGTPCVGIHYLPGETDGLPSITTDNQMFYTKALHWLRLRNRHRLAVLRAVHSSVTSPAFFRDQGFEMRDHWLCEMPVGHDQTVDSVVHLLFDYPESERPDAIIISNDSFVESVFAALHHIGVGIGRDVDIVAHCNWPWPVRSPLPVNRIGFHTHDFINEAINILGDIASGKTPQRLTLVPALDEAENTRVHPE